MPNEIADAARAGVAAVHDTERGAQPAVALHMATSCA